LFFDEMTQGFLCFPQLSVAVADAVALAT